MIRRRDEGYDSPFDDEGAAIDQMSISNFSKKYMSENTELTKQQVGFEATQEYLHNLTQKAYLHALDDGDHLEYDAQLQGTLPTRLMQMALSR